MIISYQYSNSPLSYERGAASALSYLYLSSYYYATGKCQCQNASVALEDPIDRDHLDSEKYAGSSTVSPVVAITLR